MISHSAWPQACPRSPTANIVRYDGMGNCTCQDKSCTCACSRSCRAACCGKPADVCMSASSIWPPLPAGSEPHQLPPAESCCVSCPPTAVAYPQHLPARGSRCHTGSVAVPWLAAGLTGRAGAIRQLHRSKSARAGTGEPAAPGAGQPGHCQGSTGFRWVLSRVLSCLLCVQRQSTSFRCQRFPALAPSARVSQYENYERTTCLGPPAQIVSAQPSGCRTSAGVTSAPMCPCRAFAAGSECSCGRGSGHVRRSAAGNTGERSPDMPLACHDLSACLQVA